MNSVFIQNPDVFTLDKKSLKVLKDLRHIVHMKGELLTLRQLLDRIAIYDSRVCMVEKKKDLIIKHTVNDFRSDVYALGTALLDLGLKGKNISILGENSYAWVVAFFAITCGVGVAVPVDKELRDEDLSKLFTKGDAEAVFFSRPYKSTVEYHLANTDTCRQYICMNKKLDDDRFLFIDDLIAKGKELIANGDTRYRDTKVEKDDLCAIIFTSGTTGSNKGVMLTHGNLAQNADGILETIDPEQYSSISLLPMSHVYELSGNILTSLYMNCVVYINDSLKNFQSNLELFKPDAMAVVPLVLDTVYNSIWRTAEQTGRADKLRKGIKLSNALMKVGIDIRPKLFKQIADKFGGKFPTMSCGGAPTRIEYVQCLCDIGFKIYNGYGLTEASPTVTLNMDCRNYPASAGYCFPKAKMTIHEPDENGIGEIWIKGENVTPGYYKDEAANKASFEDGWFKTGDYGYIGEKGQLFISGRKKNLIILDNGKNVHPEEVEAFFMEHIEYIHEIVVFEHEKMINGKPQKIIAAGFQITDEDLPGLSEKEILEKLTADVEKTNREITQYKRIQDFFLSTTPFEINSTRKVVRRKVIERYEKHLAEQGGNKNA